MGEGGVRNSGNFCCSSSSPKQPGNAGCGALYRMVVVVAWIQLKYCVDPLALIEGLDLLRVLSDTSQNRIAGFALLVPQGKIHTLRPALWFMGDDILFHAGKPKRAGYAANP